MTERHAFHVSDVVISKAHEASRQYKRFGAELVQSGGHCCNVWDHALDTLG